MRDIKFRHKQIKQIRSGRKTMTMRPAAKAFEVNRNGDLQCKYTLGKALRVCSPDGTATGLYVRIWSGALRPLRSITPAEVRAEGFRKRRDLQRAWDRMYYNRPDLQWSANPIVVAFHVEPANLDYAPGNCPTWVIPFDETPGVWDLDAVRLFHFMGADEVDDLFGILSEVACHDSNLNGELS